MKGKGSLVSVYLKKWGGEMKKIFITLVVLVLSGCNQPRGPSPEQLQRIKELRSEAAIVQVEISKAQERSDQYKGGLLKTLIDTRIEILKTNEALLEQFALALESGAKIDQSVKAHQPDQDRANEISAEIQKQKLKLAEAKGKADAYSGGLLKVLSLSTVVTIEQSIAILEQQHLSARFGLQVPELKGKLSVPNLREATSSDSSTKETATPINAAEKSTPCLSIALMDSSVVDDRHIAWKVDVKNKCNEPYDVLVEFTVFDKDEFKLDDDSERIFIPANGVGKARGKMLIYPPEIMPRIERIGASISAY